MKTNDREAEIKQIKLQTLKQFDLNVVQGQYDDFYSILKPGKKINEGGWVSSDDRLVSFNLKVDSDNNVSIINIGFNGGLDINIFKDVINN